MATTAKISDHRFSGTSTIDNVKSAGFTDWCESLEHARLFVMAGLLFFQCSVVIPALLLLAQVLNTAHTDILALVAVLSTMAVLVTNIATLSMKTIVVTFIINMIIMISLILIPIMGIF
ncbi:MAG: hypothetical protein ACK4ND_12665 [Cytophagaceae bacterium]